MKLRVVKKGEWKGRIYREGLKEEEMGIGQNGKIKRVKCCLKLGCTVLCFIVKSELQALDLVGNPNHLLMAEGAVVRIPPILDPDPADSYSGLVGQVPTVFRFLGSPPNPRKPDLEYLLGPLAIAYSMEDILSVEAADWT
nr:hypothetical protein Iba_chr06fCG1230 [Ipomoea batatas]